jgi:hypothetical protein
MVKPLSFLWAFLGLLALAASSGAQGIPVSRNAVIHVTKPMIVGFFPPSTDAALQTDNGTIEGMAHLSFAIEDALKCILDSGKRVEATIIMASSLVIEQNSERRRIRLSRRWPESVGAYLLAPGKRPRAVVASNYPSLLGETLLPEAAAYFMADKCRGH